MPPRNILTLIIAYSLAIPVGCKSRNNENSRVADVPTTETAYEKLMGFDMQGKAAATNLMEAFRSLKIHEDLPMVVYNRRDGKMRIATPEESLGMAPLSEKEELYFGSPDSLYFAGMSFNERPSNSNPQAVTMRLEKFKYVYKKPQRERRLVSTFDALNIKFQETADIGKLRTEIGKKMTEINSFFSKPEFTKDLAVAKRGIDKLSKPRRDVAWAPIPILLCFVLAAIGMMAHLGKLPKALMAIAQKHWWTVLIALGLWLAMVITPIFAMSLEEGEREERKIQRIQSIFDSLVEKYGPSAGDAAKDSDIEAHPGGPEIRY